jgi:hypothetical protein
MSDADKWLVGVVLFVGTYLVLLVGRAVMDALSED